MKRRTFLLTSLGAAGAVMLGSCSSDSDSDDPSSGGRPTVRYSGGIPFGFPSPFAYFGGPGYALMINIYDTLLQEDSNGEVLPMLARRFETSEDGLTWSFELRDDARWHDGRPFTVEDVLFSFEYYRTQTLSPQLIARPLYVTDVTATGGQGVDIRLDTPARTFGTDVASKLPMVPKHIWESIPDAAMAQELDLLVGSGPYRLEQFSQAEGAYRYVANDDWYLGRPYVEVIEFRPVADALSAILAGEIDVADTEVTGTPDDALIPFRDDPSYGILEYPTAITIPLKWNLERGGALADVRFRQACAHAIDREEIVQRVTGGNGTPGNPAYLVPTSPFAVDVPQYPFDPARANRLLDDAGYVRTGPDGVRQGPDGQPLRFTMLNVDIARAVAELVVGRLKDVGVEITPRSVPLPTLLGGADYEMAIAFDGGFGPGSDPDHLRVVYSSISPAFQHPLGYQNPAVDDLTARQLVTRDQDELADLIAQIQPLVAEDLPVLPLYYPDEFSIYRTSGFTEWNTEVVGTSLTETKRNFATGMKQGLEIRQAE